MVGNDRKGSRVGEPLLVSIIDDDKDVRLALGALLTSIGYQVECYDSAESFLADDKALASGCIVSDIQMSGISGVELARRLRAEGLCAPIILISAFATDAVRAQAARSGVRCLLEKPFNPETLLDEIQSATGERAPLI
jgi:FixJ family two-component response regulator